MSEKGVSILFLLIWNLGSLYFALKAGFFQRDERNRPFRISLPVMLGAFLVYLGALLVIFPFLAYLFAYLIKGEVTAVKTLGQPWTGWIHLLSMSFVALALALYLKRLNKETVRSLFFGDRQKGTASEIRSDLFMGAVTWIIAYPLVLLTSMVCQLIMEKFWGVETVKQVAVQELLQTLAHKGLFISMALVVTIVVPFIEELLFRGFLQTWLRSKIGVLGAIGLTSLIFASVHFASSQGKGNVEIIASLFVFSLFIGFIYEKRQSLIASMTVHGLFNAVNIIGLLFAK